VYVIINKMSLRTRRQQHENQFEGLSLEAIAVI
jgi:hypothetical protein